MSRLNNPEVLDQFQPIELYAMTGKSNKEEITQQDIKTYIYKTLDEFFSSRPAEEPATRPKKSLADLTNTTVAVRPKKSLAIEYNPE